MKARPFKRLWNSSSTYHDVDCSSSHSIGSSNTDHLRDERTEADSRLAHRGWEHLHGLFCRRIKWKQMENNKNMFFMLGGMSSEKLKYGTHTNKYPNSSIYVVLLYLNIGHNKSGWDVHLENHAEHLDQFRDATNGELRKGIRCEHSRITSNMNFTW